LAAPSAAGFKTYRRPDDAGKELMRAAMQQLGTDDCAVRPRRRFTAHGAHSQAG